MTRFLRPVLVAGLLALPIVPLAASPASAEPVATFDGDPATTERLNEGEPIHAAVDISLVRFPDGGAAHAVLSRDDSFADALAGSGLTGDGPLLFTETATLSAPTAAELERVLDAGATVYLLGGTAAVSDAVADDLRTRGYAVVRLAGADRIATALAVADEVRRLHPEGDDVLLARADGWADSVTGGAVAAATNTPVLVTGSSALHPSVKAWLDADAPATTTLLGGTAALSKAVEHAAPNARRVSGTDRTATATAIADALWSADGDRYVVTQGLADNSWTFGFAAAGLAADAEAPILLVTDEVTDATAAVVSTCGAPAVDLTVVGDGGVVPAALREQLDAADGFACGPGKQLVYPDDLTTFPECQSLLQHLQQSALERVGPYGLGGFGTYGRGEPIPVEENEGIGDTPDTPEAPNDGGGDDADTAADESLQNDSSGTNVQEEGVDEPDTVKSNGQHAFVVAQNELRVVRTGGGAPLVVATMALPTDGSSELLLSGNRLLVLTRHWSFVIFDDLGVADGDAALIAPGEPAEARTTLTYVDVTNPAAPTVTSTMELDGDYRSARMIGSVARLVVQTDPNGLAFTYPADGSAEAEHAAAEHNRQVVADTTLEDWLPTYTVDGGADTALLDCDDVRRPPLFSGLGTLSVLTVDLAGGITPTSSAAVLAAGETVYASTNRLFVTTGRWDWEPDALGSQVQTEVHGFDISSPTATAYVGSGAVDGYILSSFSLSEHEGNLRIATTTAPPWDSEMMSESIVTVLAEQGGDLVAIGRLGGLGLDERIYAVRWFGPVGAVVTFREVDPLYLLDLSDPTNPRVSGELKLPGFSSYLHRIDDTHLLGVGSEADADGRVTGAAVSLFDISDVSAPALVQKVVLPNGSTQVSYDHHAFLHWPATGLAVLPLEVYEETGESFIGAVGIDVAATGLTEVGRASHVDDVDRDAVWPSINRSFVAGGSLYTVSEGGIEQATLDGLVEQAFARF